MNALLLLASFPNDSGPIYQETLQGRFPVEPFNTFSNFFFLAIVIYFSFKVYKDFSRHRFLGFSLPILLIGFTGGTIYHATRSHEIWLLLDWVPILVLCLAVSVYFTLRVNLKRRYKSLLIAIVLLLVFGIRLIPFPSNLEISVNYIGTALGLLLPMFTYIYRTHFRHSRLVLLAILSFSLALAFRLLDRLVYFLPMGSHWLWHSFGALSVFFIIYYIYLDKTEIKSA
ncbi:hypothetical protein [Salegentibacter chungangensis]|uniref:Ceramidase n=1 Tax=Salegentibacter chungangensis TaxID=1335724 RepID=A0ABW3NP43_9FLAO